MTEGNIGTPVDMSPVFPSGVGDYSLRITIPKRLVNLMGIKKGDKLIFRLTTDGTITITKAPAEVKSPMEVK